MDKSLENLKCPECQGPMVSRKSNYGVFWGCKAYPECKGTRDSMGRSKAEREAFKREKEREKEEPKDLVDNGMTFNKKR